jgi:hypothetical protein
MATPRVRFTGPIPELTPAEIVRFQGMLHLGGCGLRWAGGDVNTAGYGRFSIYRQGKRIRIFAHRLAYKLATGEDPGSVIIRHGCDVRLCCTVTCLTPGTFADNSRDAVERGRLVHPRARDAATERLTVGEKRCPRCGEVKPLSMFARQSKRLDGRQTECRACLADRKRQLRSPRHQGGA